MTVKIAPPPRSERVSAVPANIFNISFVGDQIQVDAAYLDISEVAASKKQSGSGVPTLRPESVARLVMSLQAFAMLRSRVVQIANSLKENGVDLDQVRLMEEAPHK